METVQEAQQATALELVEWIKENIDVLKPEEFQRWLSTVQYRHACRIAHANRMARADRAAPGTPTDTT